MYELLNVQYSKPALNGTSKEDQKLGFKTDNRSMQVKIIEVFSPLDHSATLLTGIKRLSVFKTFVLSIFEWPLKTGFTVYELISNLPYLEL